MYILCVRRRGSQSRSVTHCHTVIGEYIENASHIKVLLYIEEYSVSSSIGKESILRNREQKLENSFFID